MSKTVVAKFDCINSIDREGETTFDFMAAIDGPENKEWAAYTPAGHIGIVIKSDCNAAKVLTAGKSYKVTFEELPE